MSKRWREYARQYGPVGLIKCMVGRMLRPLWEETCLLVFHLRPPVLAISAKVNLTIIELTPDMARRVAWMVADWERRWQRGEVCYSAWVEGACVHYSWVTRTDSYMGEVHHWLVLNRKGAYIYDCFTDGRYRGIGVFPAVLSAIAQDLFSQGIRQIFVSAEKHNHSSIRAIQRAGFALAGEIKYQRLGYAVRISVDQVSSGPEISIRKS